MKLLEQLLPLPEFHIEEATEILTNAFRREIQKTGLGRVVVGVSGGIDSALTLMIAAKALGPQNVFAFYIPYRTSSPDSLKHGKEVVAVAGVAAEEISIADMADAYFAEQKDISPLRMGNVMARLRMIVLYDQSARMDALVAGTSNKTESLLGYSTLWGDMASAVNPIGDLYKHQVRLLSAHFGVPDSILQKAPSADLWEGQSDEQEIGLTYDLMDRVLFHLLERGLSVPEVETLLSGAGEKPETASFLWKRIARNQFKRKMPVLIKISDVTIDREFRYPRDWGL